MLEKETGFAEIEWSKHPAYKGVWLKHIITVKDTDRKFSYYLVRINLDCSIGNHIHGTPLETYEVIKGSGRSVIFISRPGGLITEITWKVGNLEVICEWHYRTKGEILYT